MSVRVAIRAIGPIDLRSVRRDSFLVAMFPLLILMGLAIRFALWPVTFWLRESLQIDIEPYHVLFVTYVSSLFAPLLIGQVVGILLLDERDANIHVALRVSPLPATSYALYRLSLPLALSVIASIGLVALVALPTPPAQRLLPLILVSALEAPIFALLLAGFAANKVQGFALIKALGGVQMLPIAALFIPLPWQYLAGPLPSYWLVRAFWQASAGGFSFWALVAAATVTHLALLALLIRRFATRSAV